MCGIIAFLSKHHSAAKYLLEGLTILQNRGYDSAGICTINQINELINSKFASTNVSALEMLQNNIDIHSNHHIGISHTRWATHGCKTDYNAHPHLDYKNRLAIVHNGIIENYQEIKDYLITKNITFKSDTDTEVIVNLISYYLDKNYDIWKSINKAINRLEGTWGIAILYNEEPNHIYLCKKGSPLLVAYDNDFTIVASESSAFSKYTNRYIVLRDNEIIRLGADKDEKILDYEFKEIEELEEIKLTPDPYPHWMLKEIFEQPITSLRALNMGGRIADNYNIRLGGLNSHREELLKIDNILIIASGTSYIAGMLGVKYFKSLKCFNTVTIIDAAEFVLDDLPNENAGIIVLSQSGETKDVHCAIELAKLHNIMVIGIVNVVGSLISRDSDCGCYLNAGREVAVASTKSFTSQVVVLSLMALWFSQNKVKELKNKRGMLIDNIRNVSLNFTNIIQNISTNVGDDLIARLKDCQNMFVLGRGLGYPIACEGALKIKEISYIHAESYPGGALKHGPFALIEEGMPIIMIVLDDEYANRMHSAAEEVKARGAYTIIITNLKKYNKKIYDYCINIPDCGVMTSLLCVMPLQYLAYKLGMAKGYNVDFPRNLCKAITIL